MKLTPRGRDYLVASVIIVVSGAVTGQSLFEALALAMGVAALLSLGTLRLKAYRSLRVRALNPSVRGFKGDELSADLEIPSLADRWVSVVFESAKFDGPVEATVVPWEGNFLRLRLRPSLAGRFRGAKVAFACVDTLGLFKLSKAEAKVDLKLDALPVSLLGPVRRPYVSPLALGENPAGGPGRGQEFYGVEEYTFRSESRDILWKRAARDPDRPLLARVRESNVPGSVSLGVARGSVQGDRVAPYADLLCEALGGLARPLLLLGIEVHFSGPGFSTLAVRSDEELAEAIMDVAEAVSKAGEGSEGPITSDILVLVGAVQDESGSAIRGRQFVAIGGGVPARRGASGVEFTGVEDLSGVINSVMAA
jgi:uncharacterized protein (DUF58 family)